MTEIAYWDEIICGADPKFLRGTRPAAQSVLPDTIVLGMPHLCASGLSESWLLKELGHRHWYLLAEAASMSAPEFRDEKGGPVYAAFCSVSITCGEFGAARENDLLTLASRLIRVSRTQVASCHRIAIHGRSIGLVEMISTFVRRGAAGTNRSVARVAVEGLPAIGHDTRREGMNSRRSEAQPRRQVATFLFDPCPSQDFNGAGLLYFTSFIAFLDRAEWLFDRRLALAASTVERAVAYRGNVDPGERIRVSLFDPWEEQGRFGHGSRLERAEDGTILAEIRSLRSVGGSGGRRKDCAFP